jgi:hypothetical protein
MYEVIADPPSETGAAQVTRIVPAPGTKATCVGFVATVLGTTEFEPVGFEIPALLIATTSTTYAVPLARETPFAAENVHVKTDADTLQISPVDRIVAV